MTFQQLTYIIAVDRVRHFAQAAKACFVTQPTLSMMIKRLEDELDAQIFDRSKQPVETTPIGKKIIAQARVILNQRSVLLEILHQERVELEGDLRIGIIPTLTPYLVPLFIDSFRHSHPKIVLQIDEMTTEGIIENLKADKLDLGVLATPLLEKNLKETPIFYEQFFLYGPEKNKTHAILPSSINIDDLLLLEEGHCLRSQILNLCELKKKTNLNVSFKTGSLETLKRLVEKNQGTTILPHLAILDLSKEQYRRITPFREPTPVREISIVSHTSYIKQGLLRCLQEAILGSLPKEILETKPYDTVTRPSIFFDK